MQFGGAGTGGGTGGNLLVLIASLAAAAYALMARRMLVQRSALYLTTFQHLVGALFIVPLAVVEILLVGVRRPTPTAVGALVYLTLISSIAGYLMLNYALGHVEASKVSVFINLTPVVGVAGAYRLLGERFTLPQVVSSALVVLGVWLTSSTRGAAVDPRPA